MATYATCAAWIEALRADPANRLNRMLRQWDGISPYQRGRPFDTIRIALSEAGTEGDRWLIDGELAAWLAARLAEPPETVADIGWNSYVAALMEAFGLLSAVALPMTGALLRDRHAMFEDWTRGLSEEGPGNIRTRYLLALAHNQGETRRFQPLWQRLCRDAGAGLPTPKEADFHLTIGLLGLRLLPAPSGHDTVAEEANGLIRWAERLPNTDEARTDFLSRWRMFTDAWFRESAEWLDMLEQELADRATRPFAAWLREELGIKSPSKTGTVPEPIKADTDKILAEIQNLSWDMAKRKIEKFIAWHERYAQATTSLAHLPMALNRLGNALLRLRNCPEALPLAERVAVNILNHAPSDEPSWVLWSKALQRMGHPHAAEAVLWRACRFMSDKTHVRNVLAEAMESEGRVAEAEALYRDTVKRFPKDQVAPTALAKLLADNGRIKEAEALYRTTVKRFLNDPFCRLDLGLLLLAQGRPLMEVQPLLEDLVRMKKSEADTLRRHMDAARHGRLPPRRQSDHAKRSASRTHWIIERDPDWSAFIASGDALHAEFLLSSALNDPNLRLMTPEKRGDLRKAAETMLREAIQRAPNNPVVRLIAARYPKLIAKTIDADTARRVAGGDFGLRLELALRDKDEEAVGYVFEDFHDPGHQAVAACAWLWLTPDSDLPGAEEAAEHLRHWLANDVPETALPALVHIHDELRERLPSWSRNADRQSFLESWDSVHEREPIKVQIRALIDIALLGLVLADMPMLADLPLSA